MKLALLIFGAVAIGVSIWLYRNIDGIHARVMHYGRKEQRPW